MTADAPVSGWTDAVIAFLARNTNRGDGAETWDHIYSSAYQMACMALVALGQAEETDRGARRLRAPRLPVPLPRWDDICVAVLFLAQQRSLLHFRLADGSPPPPRTSGFTIVRIGGRPPPPPPSPNIAAIPGLGPAHATPEALHVLSALGLIAAGRWTTVAECVLWRDAPTVWQMRVTDDPRFAAAVASAITTLPTDRRSEIDRLVTITASDIEESLAQSVALQEQARLKYGPKAQMRPPETPEKTRRSLAFVRRYHLDDLFERHWRLPEGWLTPPAANRALGIFHDSLATAMRRAVLSQLYPERPEWGTA